MRFLVLGPLRIQPDLPLGTAGVADYPPPPELLVGASKQRALLAILVVNLNHVIPVDRLIDELWEDPPPTAVNVLRQYVSKLRKLLGQGEGVELRTFSAGYDLRCAHGGSDAQDFERLVQDARRNLRAARPAEAREAASRALGLWQGYAFSDVPCGPYVAAERARLEEIRVSAQALHAEAMLRCGEIADAVSEFTALTIHNPLREGLQASLMRALSAEGRTADALKVYRNAREVLLDELGIEPGTELRSLQHDILTGSLDPVEDHAAS